MGVQKESSILFVVPAALARSDAPRLCSDLHAALRASTAQEVVCDVSLAPADVVAIETLCRLFLIAKRCGRRPRLRGVSPELAELIELVGLRRTLAGSVEAGSAEAGR
jgi:anti-anti-sigma regulatory factor